MHQARVLSFADWQLDLTNECLWRGCARIQLTPKNFALLRYFIGRAVQLVTKTELLNVLWPDVCVSEKALTTHIYRLRQMLGDQSETPQYIETVHRRGYRFIAPLFPTALFAPDFPSLLASSSRHADFAEMNGFPTAVTQKAWTLSV
jgi:DNA-binding winged helix-turn-helix (wHTH) protein